MTRPSWVLLFVAACGNGKAPTQDAGDDGAAEAGVVFTYAPAGCKYTVTPTHFGLSPASGNFQDGNGDDTLALDDTVAPSGDITPSLVRVGVGGGTDSSAAGYADPRTTAAFMWETPTPTHAAKVKIGTSATSSLTDVHTGYSWITPKDLGTTTTNAHAVHVCGLTAGTTYYYQVGGGPTGSETWSAVQSFTTDFTSNVAPNKLASTYAQPTSVRKSEDWIDGNLFFEPISSVRIGLEYAAFIDHYVDGVTAINHRGQLSGFFLF